MEDKLKYHPKDGHMTKSQNCPRNSIIIGGKKVKSVGAPINYSRYATSFVIENSGNIRLEVKNKKIVRVVIDLNL